MPYQADQKLNKQAGAQLKIHILTANEIIARYFVINEG